jgi:hypothetical protein
MKEGLLTLVIERKERGGKKYSPSGTVDKLQWNYVSPRYSGRWTLFVLTQNGFSD